jgi:hypothetical protein
MAENERTCYLVYDCERDAQILRILDPIVGDAVLESQILNVGVQLRPGVNSVKAFLLRH